MDLSVVIPALNAAATLPATLDALGRAPREVIVVDGGSTDATAAIAAARGCRLIAAPRGRGSQLAAGVAAARGPWLLLLHADTRLGPGWAEAAAAHIAAAPDRAGYFRLRIDDAAPAARRLERAVAWRCRALGLPYGDQGLLVARALLDAVGGIRPLPLMEDVDLVRRLGRARLVPLPADALTSAARYRRDGYLRRSARNLALLALWFAGVPPRVLVRLY
ncbi:TIGR04283 family arsenosugar biosynthesis glycosyltransferase [Elioraea sp.]|uniref:TIGR04283 family arsenosugar biosynthesis glycosyltransferase n=2 Tax=Elioraea sp. TaxID=2185103 RepID=UPI0021DC2B79|nr:TIGR04283 family arsenosugar biosynthesis glycosyltransferase [Elioraea sp.]GIX09584.1 MAG: glycosyl transferase [Elioraea sp.]